MGKLGFRNEEKRTLAILGLGLLLVTLSSSCGGSEKKATPRPDPAKTEPYVPQVDPETQACADDLIAWSGAVLRDPSDQITYNQVQTEIMQVYGLDSFEADFFFGEVMPKTISISVQEGYSNALARATRLISKACSEEYG